MRNILFFIIFTLAFSMPVYSEITSRSTLNEDGFMFLPQVRVGGNYFEAGLQSQADSSVVQSFNLVSAKLIDKVETNSESNYQVKTGTLEVSNLFIDGVPYAATLQLQANGTYQIISLSRSDLISFLYMIVAPTASFKTEGNYGDTEVGNHFVLDVNSGITAFSDRPHRVAKSFEGGLSAFVEAYGTSDFNVDPPNVTFSGQNTVHGEQEATIFEMENPFVFEDQVIIPIVSAIGTEQFPTVGMYANTSFIVDSIFGDILEVAGGVIGIIATGVATAAACTVGEAVTVGVDTPVCIAGVAATIGATAATTGAIANLSADDK